jgi:hypothetical protein
VDLPAQEVTRAFGIRTFTPSPMLMAPEETTSSSGTITKGITAIIAVVVLAIATQSLWNRSSAPAGVRKTATLVSPLVTGKTGMMAGKSCTLTKQTTVEISRVRSKYDWLEYALDDGELLVGGMNVGANEWFLFQLEKTELSPQQAAALHAGSQITIGGKTLRVEDVFQYRTPTRTGFGLLARSGSDRAIVRWTENRVDVYLGIPVAEKEVLGAFGSRLPGNSTR